MMRPAAVYCLAASALKLAAALADETGLPMVDASGLCHEPARERHRFVRDDLAQQPALAYLVDADGVQLALIDAGRVVGIRAGFHGSTMDYRRAKGGGRSEMIARAVGLKGGEFPSVVDATAGLGGDAFVLASLGCPVTLLERVPAVYVLLEDGLRRSRDYAAEADAALEEILNRMRLVRGEAAGYLEQLDETDLPDVIYLDPMFPERKKSAAVKKEMQIFHKLVGPDEDAGRVFAVALRRARKRVVVKRPRIAPTLTEAKPNHTLEGKRNRYDIYLTA